MNALAMCSLALLASPPQDPNEVLATYQLQGRPAIVTRTDVALEMAFHMRRRERGQQACDLLVDAHLTRRAATQKNLMPTEAEVRAFWQQLQDQLRAAGRRPEEFAAVRNTSMSQWLDDLALQMAQERLVRAELDLGPKEAVSADMLKLWLQEERQKAKVVVDADHLPAGVAARVADRDLPVIDVGFLLLRTSEDEERDRFVRQVVYLQSIEALASREQVQLTDADLDAALQRRRDDAARDPRYRGASFDQLLKAEGMTVAALRQLRVFRAQVLLTKLADKLHPFADLQAELQRDRQAVLDLVGPRRRLAIVFVRALEEPNGLIPRDFAAATRKLEEVRDRLAKDSFETVARIESEHPGSKPGGGDVGWHRRRSKDLPEPVLSAAFTLAAGEVSPPVRGDDGCYLVKVLEIDPDPSDARLIALLREWKAQELGRRVLEEAAIEIATPKPGAAR